MHYSTSAQPSGPEDGYCFDFGSLYAEFEKLTDKRDARGLRYSLATVLTLIVLAKLAGEDRPCGIADWVDLRARMLAQALGLTRQRMPHHMTYRRVLQHAITVVEIEQRLAAFLTRTPEGGRSVVLNLDGKTLRGTIPAGQTQGVHLLAAYLPAEGIVLLEVEVGSRENEISAAPRLLKCLDLRGKVVTGDALLAQRELSVQVVSAGGDYLWPIKENQPSVREAIATLFEQERAARGPAAHDFRQARTLEKGHGRIEERELTASQMLNEYLDWPGLGQVFEIKRERFDGTTGKQTHEVVYGVTSLRAEEASPARLLELVRAHWGIENGLHYRRDVTFREDACRMKSKTAAQVLAALNNLVIGLIRRAGFTNAAQARRHYDARPYEALSLVLRCPT